MEKDKFAAILPVIISGLVKKIVEDKATTEDEAIRSLYNSQLYTALEDEATKIWTWSVPRLFRIYQEEIETGVLNLAE